MTLFPGWLDYILYMTAHGMIVLVAPYVVTKGLWSIVFHDRFMAWLPFWLHNMVDLWLYYRFTIQLLALLLV